QASEILRATYLPRQSHIQRARLFFCGIISTDMNRIGEYPIVLGKNLVRAIALVGIGIDYKYPPLRVGRMQVANGDGDIVEDAIAKPAIRKGVVCSTCQIAS